MPQKQLWNLGQILLYLRLLLISFIFAEAYKMKTIVLHILTEYFMTKFKFTQDGCMPIVPNGYFWQNDNKNETS